MQTIEEIKTEIERLRNQITNDQERAISIRQYMKGYEEYTALAPIMNILDAMDRTTARALEEK